MSKKVNFMCTAFRDGLQSMYDARVLTRDFLPAVEAARDAGITYFEAGGGERFQALYAHCNEDAFAMMDAFREAAGPDAELQSLARGVNLVGLEPQPSDVIELHARLFKRHGINKIRNFDALNDVDNLVYSGRCISAAGLGHQVCITMMELPPGFEGAHDPEYYTLILQKILDADVPFDAVCFKDPTGTSSPLKVHETIKQARRILPEGAAIHFHTHGTAGTGVSANMAALDAGADAIDLSLAPCSGAGSQPDVLVMWHALRHSEYDLDIDHRKVREAEEVFKDCMGAYRLSPDALAVNPLIALSPMSGRALSANTRMMRAWGSEEKCLEVLQGMGEVIQFAGYATSATPVSQFYFQQAYDNVEYGPWERIDPGYGRLVLGYFGKTPVPPNPEIVALASTHLDLSPAERSPLELSDADPEKGVEAARRLLNENKLDETEENVFIAAVCREQGLAFLRGEAEVEIYEADGEPGAAPVSVPAAAQLFVPPSPRPTGEEPAVASEERPEEGLPAGYSVTVNGREYSVLIEEDKVVVDGREYDVDIQPRNAEVIPRVQSDEGTPVTAQMPGKVIRNLVSVGDHVQTGETILVLEAMKMEMPINAPVGGTVSSITVSSGDQVSTGQVLASIA